MSRSVVLRVSNEFYKLMKQKHMREMPEVDFTEFTKFMTVDKKDFVGRRVTLNAKRKCGGGMDFELDFTSL